MVKKILLISCVAVLCFGMNSEPANEQVSSETSMPSDARVSLGIKGTMQGEHQLSNMREHLKALAEIIKLMDSAKYDEASKIATEKLGLTVQMNSMCGSFDNKSFETMGVSFHKAGDNLAQTLKTKEYKKSMQALEKVMNGCVVCHSAFKQ